MKGKIRTMDDIENSISKDCVYGCGNPVYVSKKDGHEYRACFRCLAKMTLLVKKADEFEAMARGK